MLNTYMTVSVTIPITIVTIDMLIVTIVNKVVLQVFAVEIGA